jgi:hypothetical protein
VFEELGWRVDWLEARQTTRLQKDGISISLPVGSNTFSLLSSVTDIPNHDPDIFLDVPAQIINGRTMLPIRAILESVSYIVEWNAETQNISISTASAPQVYVPNFHPPFTITFDPQGTAQTFTTDENGRLTEMPPAPEDVLFGGWFTGEWVQVSLHGTQLRQRTNVTLATVFTEDTTVYATWISIPPPLTVQ